MARMDYGKAQRTALWKGGVRQGWSLQPPPSNHRASFKQLEYIKILLEKHGRRPHTTEEKQMMSSESASRLIQELKSLDKSST